MQRYAAAPEDARRIITPSAAITELREAEEALKSLQTELTSALRQKERLAQLGSAVSKISHDLRNILTSAQLFTDRIEMSKDPVVTRLAPKLVGSITRAVHLCESTLAFGRAEEPGPTLTQVRLVDIVEDVLYSEGLAAGVFDLVLSSEISPTMNIRADPEQMHRVLGNLVRNSRQAIMATELSGQISIGATETSQAWAIKLRDDGPGLPEKAQQHLFSAFQGSVRKGGSGLGLAIAAELVRGHGGDIKLVRTNANGTEFMITLPKGDGAF
jgi:signal transduction histidine kinase